MRPDQPLVYRPTRTFRLAVLASTLLFVIFALVGAFTGQSQWMVVTLAGCSLIGVLGVIESLIASVELRRDRVAVRSLRGVKSFPLEVIDEVRLEGGQVHLKVQGEGWVHMPPWLPGNRAMSLRAQVNKALKAHRLSGA